MYHHTEQHKCGLCWGAVQASSSQRRGARSSPWGHQQVPSLHPSEGVGQPRAAIIRQGDRDGLHPRLGQEAMLRERPSPGLHLGYSFVRRCGYGRSTHVIRCIPEQWPKKLLQGHQNVQWGELKMDGWDVGHILSIKDTLFSGEWEKRENFGVIWHQSGNLCP